MGAMLKFAFFAIVLVCALSLAADVCPVPPTVRTYIDVLKDAQARTLTASVYNESSIEGEFVRMPLSNAIVVVVKKKSVAGQGAGGYEPCLAKTDANGRAVIGYVPPEEESPAVPRTTYYFTYCPMAADRDQFSACAAIPDPDDLTKYIDYNGWSDRRLHGCSEDISAPVVERPTHLPTKTEIYLENRTKPDASDLCWPLMLIVGLLAGAMFATGRSPFAAFDFSAPRLSRGKQYNPRTQSKSFDATAIAFAAYRAGSVGAGLSAGGKTEAKVTDKKDKDGNTIIINGKTGKEIGTVGKDGTVVVNGLTVGKVENGKLMVSGTSFGHGNAKFSSASKEVKLNDKGEGTFTVRHFGLREADSPLRSMFVWIGGKAGKGAAGLAKATGLSAGAKAAKDYVWKPAVVAVKGGAEKFAGTKVGGAVSGGAAAAGSGMVKVVGVALSPLSLLVKPATAVAMRGAKGPDDGKGAAGAAAKGGAAVGVKLESLKADLGNAKEQLAQKQSEYNGMSRQMKGSREGSKLQREISDLKKQTGDLQRNINAIPIVQGTAGAQAGTGTGAASGTTGTSSYAGAGAVKTSTSAGLGPESSAASTYNAGTTQSGAWIRGGTVLAMPQQGEGLYKAITILFGKSSGDRDAVSADNSPITFEEFMDKVGNEILRRLLTRLMVFALLAALNGKFGGTVGKAFGKVGKSKLLSVKGMGKFSIGDGLGVLAFSDSMILPVLNEVAGGANEKWAREMGKMENAQEECNRCTLNREALEAIAGTNYTAAQRDAEINGRKNAISSNEERIGQNKLAMKSTQKGSAEYTRLAGENKALEAQNSQLGNEVRALGSRAVANTLFQYSMKDEVKAKNALLIMAEDAVYEDRKRLYGISFSLLGWDVGIRKGLTQKAGMVGVEPTDEQRKALEGELDGLKATLSGLIASNGTKKEIKKAQEAVEKAEEKLATWKDWYNATQTLNSWEAVRGSVNASLAALNDMQWASRVIAQNNAENAKLKKMKEDLEDLKKEKASKSAIKAEEAKIERAQKALEDAAGEYKYAKGMMDAADMQVNAQSNACGVALTVLGTQGSRSIVDSLAAASGGAAAAAVAMPSAQVLQANVAAISGFLLAFSGAASAAASASYAGFKMGGDVMPAADLNIARQAASGIRTNNAGEMDIGAMENASKGLASLAKRYDSLGEYCNKMMAAGYWQIASEFDRKQIVARYAQLYSGIGESEHFEHSKMQLKGKNTLVDENKKEYKAIVGDEIGGYRPVSIMKDGRYEEFGRVDADGNVQRGVYGTIEKNAAGGIMVKTASGTVYEVSKTDGTDENGIAKGSMGISLLVAGSSVAAFVGAPNATTGFFARDINADARLVQQATREGIDAFLSDTKGLYTLTDEKGRGYGTGKNIEEWRAQFGSEQEQYAKIMEAAKLGVGLTVEKGKDGAARVDIAPIDKPNMPFGFGFRANMTAEQLAADAEFREKLEQNDIDAWKSKLQLKDRMELEARGKEGVLDWLASHTDVLAAGKPIVITVGAGASVEEAADDAGNRKLAGERRGIGIGAVKSYMEESGLGKFVEIKEGEIKVAKYYDVKEAGKLSADERKNAASDFNSLVLSWKSEEGGEDEVQKAIKARVISYADGAYTLLDRAKFEAGFSKGSTDAAGNHENKGNPALEEALKKQRQVTVKMDVEIKQEERVEMPYAQILATEHSVGTARGEDLMTGALLENLKYKQKEIRDGYLGSASTGAEGSGGMGTNIEDMRKRLMDARSSGEDASELVNAAYAALRTDAPEAGAYAQRVGERRGEWERLYDSQMYVSVRNYLKANPDPNPEDLFARTVLTVPKAVTDAIGSDVMKDSPSFVHDGSAIDAKSAEMSVMEKGRLEYRMQVTNEMSKPEPTGVFAQARREADGGREFLAFSEKIANEKDAEKLLTQFANADVSKRLEMHKTYESEIGVRQRSELERDLKDVGIKSTEIAPMLEEFDRSGGREREDIFRMIYFAKSQNKKTEDGPLVANP
ncbi:Uncharacterised protein [Candidatus Anstonella stagnisolia]|nr:Uncharacterised protein [Candidatus Anstonella stagnisolia]